MGVRCLFDLRDPVLGSHLIQLAYNQKPVPFFTYQARRPAEEVSYVIYRRDNTNAAEDADW